MISLRTARLEDKRRRSDLLIAHLPRSALADTLMLAIMSMVYHWNDV